ncbi:serine/threonine-protein kinase [Spirillospora sp. NPDC127200]
MPPAPLRSSDPPQVGGYRLTERLGRGGMGTVYLSTDAAGHRVAVKVINAELGEDAAFQERFRREVTAARQVRRFCTAAVLDARLDGDPLYVVTEYVEGPTLGEAVAERGPMRGGDLDALAVGIATALNAIHGAGIVHRDLKPANVLLSPTGPRVIDFGIARALDAVDGPTRTGQFVGTPAYIAPELMTGGAISPAADVFAWGCVVAFAGTGRAPFTGRTVPEVLYRVAHEEPDLTGLDPALRDLVASALDKDPARRPSAQGLITSLTGGRPTPAVPSPPAVPPAGASPPTRTDLSTAPPRPGRRKRLALAATAAAALLATGAGWSYLSRDPGTGPAAPGGARATRDTGPPKTGAAIVPVDSFGSAATGWDDGDCGSYSGGALEITADGDSGMDECREPSERSGARGRTLHAVTLTFLENAADAPAWYGGLVLADSDASVVRYEVLLSSAGKVRFRKVVDGGPVSATVRDAPVEGFEPTGANRLQVEVDQAAGENRFRVWANGRLALTAGDADAPRQDGADALAVHPGGNEDEVTVAFDDYSVHRIG